MTDKVIKNCYGTDPVAVFILKKNENRHLKTEHMYDKIQEH